MINIRYHIVSITAVFLALGIGVALGSTFLDRATVEVLDRNIRNAEARIRETNATNDRLQDEVTAAADRDASLIVVGSQDLFADHLTDVPVLIVTAPGVDAETADALKLDLEHSDADVRGTIELGDDMLFDGDVDAGLAEDLGLDDPSAAELRDAVMGDVRAAFAAAGQPVVVERPDEDPTTTTQPEGTASTTTTTTTEPGSDGGEGVVPDGTQPDIISTLIERGFLRLTPGPGIDGSDPILEVGGYRYVFLGTEGVEASANDVMVSLLATPAGADPLPAIVVAPSAPILDADEDEAVAPSIVDLVRSSDELAKQYTTVDNLETFAGQVAAILSLEDLGTVPAGHYGQGEGATAVLPPPS